MRTASQEISGRTMTAVATYSRRHIDLQRVAGALCPAYENAPPRLANSQDTAVQL